MYEEDLLLNNLQGLISHKTKSNQPLLLGSFWSVPDRVSSMGKKELHSVG